MKGKVKVTQYSHYNTILGVVGTVPAPVIAGLV